MIMYTRGKEERRYGKKRMTGKLVLYILVHVFSQQKLLENSVPFTDRENSVVSVMVQEGGKHIRIC